MTIMYLAFSTIIWWNVISFLNYFWIKYHMTAEKFFFLVPLVCIFIYFVFFLLQRQCFIILSLQFWYVIYSCVIYIFFNFMYIYFFIVQKNKTFLIILYLWWEIFHNLGMVHAYLFVVNFIILFSLHKYFYFGAMHLKSKTKCRITNLKIIFHFYEIKKRKKNICKYLVTSIYPITELSYIFLRFPFLSFPTI